MTLDLARPGPWQASEHTPTRVDGPGGRNDNVCSVGAVSNRDDEVNARAIATAALIAEMRSSLPALIARLEEKGSPHPLCPRCGDPHDEPEHFYYEDGVDFECHCGQRFEATPEKHTTWTSKPLADDAGEK
jgi:hypothetical protein